MRGKVSGLDLSKLSPYELGESKNVEAIEYLISFLGSGTKNERRLAASAVNKLYNLYPSECQITKPLLIKNLKHDGPQVRNYCLKAIMKMDLTDEEIIEIERICEFEDKDYNRKLVHQIVKLMDENRTPLIKFNVPIQEDFNSEQNNSKLTQSEFNVEKPKPLLEKEENNINTYTEQKQLETTNNFSYYKINIFETISYAINKVISIFKIEKQQSIKVTPTTTEEPFINYDKIEEEIAATIASFKVTNISDNEIGSFYDLQEELADEYVEEYLQLGDIFIDFLYKCLEGLGLNSRDFKILIMRLNFYGEGAKTLQTIGNEFNISRESVRQIVVKSIKKLLIYLQRKETEDNYYLKQFINKLFSNSSKELEKRVVLFFYYAFETPSPFFLKFLGEIIFIERENSANIQDMYKNYRDRQIFAENEMFKLQRMYERSLKSFKERIYNKIQWPNKKSQCKDFNFQEVKSVREVNFDLSGNSGKYFSEKLSKEIQYESELERKVLMLIENCTRVVFYEVQPFEITYYHKRKRVYIPDIFIVLDDGSGIIIEIKPKIHMAININIIKYQALESFCNEMGYGFLVTDGFTSFEEIKMHTYNKSFEDELLSELKKGPLRWSEFIKFKSKYSIGLDLSSIIINNDLIYEKSPFLIKKRT
ncbi:hypothetical protein DRW41_03675 [Neobacillus piezotolerans]|uniref:Uncharacterized protein n=1 Tax=Neobacillus piezotolerans TaxID=2259171 RepID=A0A3D8GW33_9BACI|nr:TnsA endonuclease N-terminal domain-containing protein [Neobacillus piezotolerans]RDU38670.1 hypothetical protein DRW41_03675 [Neobacillus piezotolerans]